MMPVLLAAISLITCDPFKEDSIRPDQQVQFNGAATTYYILPSSSTVINSKSILNKPQAPIKLRVTHEPRLGKLIKLNDFILKYEPNPEFSEGQDHFVYSALGSNGEVLKSDTVLIIMEHNVDEFPCKLVAVEDFVTGTPGSEISINFLDNDLLCGAEQTLRKSILLNPQHGEATLSGNTISYKPASGFTGWDQFVYEISSSADSVGISSESAIGSLGLISILINADVCVFSAKDDLFSFKVNSLMSPRLEFSAAGNDGFCAVDTLQFGISIVNAPKLGIASVLTNGRIRYEMSASFSKSYTDSLVYQACFKGICSQAKIKLVINYIATEKWTVQKSYGGHLYSVFFVNADVGYAGGFQSLFKTTNGGQTWNQLYHQALSPDIQINDIFFTDENYGFAVGSATLYGGDQAVGANATILKTTDGGSTWTKQVIGSLGSWSSLYHVYFISKMVGFADSYQTSNGGLTWEPMNAYDIIKFVDANTGYAGNDGVISRTSDGGLSWVELYKFSWFLSLTFHDGKFFVLGTNNNNEVYTQSRIWMSTNGQDWTLVSNEMSMEGYPYIRKLSFSPTNKIGFTYGNTVDEGSPLFFRPLIYKTTDMGVTWTKEFVPTMSDSHDVQDITFVNDSLAYAVGGFGLIMKYSKQ